MKDILIQEFGKSLTTLLPLDNISYINEMKTGCSIYLKYGGRMFVGGKLSDIQTLIFNAV